MGVIRIVWGTASESTAMASYDAALADANVHNYNLVSVSSVIPANATVEAVGGAPDLGPAGERLTVVEGRATVAPGRSEPAVASLGWDREPGGPGIFYETSGTDPKAVKDRIGTASPPAERCGSGPSATRAESSSPPSPTRSGTRRRSFSPCTGRVRRSFERMC